MLCFSVEGNPSPTPTHSASFNFTLLTTHHSPLASLLGVDSRSRAHSLSLSLSVAEMSVHPHTPTPTHPPPPFSVAETPTVVVGHGLRKKELVLAPGGSWVAPDQMCLLAHHAPQFPVGTIRMRWVGRVVFRVRK